MYNTVSSLSSVKLPGWKQFYSNFRIWAKGLYLERPIKKDQVNKLEQSALPVPPLIHPSVQNSPAPFFATRHGAATILACCYLRSVASLEGICTFTLKNRLVSQKPPPEKTRILLILVYAQ